MIHVSFDSIDRQWLMCLLCLSGQLKASFFLSNDSNERWLRTSWIDSFADNRGNGESSTSLVGQTPTDTSAHSSRVRVSAVYQAATRFDRPHRARRVEHWWVNGRVKLRSGGGGGGDGDGDGDEDDGD